MSLCSSVLIIKYVVKNVSLSCLKQNNMSIVLWFSDDDSNTGTRPGTSEADFLGVPVTFESLGLRPELLEARVSIMF